MKIKDESGVVGVVLPTGMVLPCDLPHHSELPICPSRWNTLRCTLHKGHDGDHLAGISDRSIVGYWHRTERDLYL